jgi:hypothetical protein
LRLACGCRSAVCKMDLAKMTWKACLKQDVRNVLVSGRIQA